MNNEIKAAILLLVDSGYAVYRAATPPAQQTITARFEPTGHPTTPPTKRTYRKRETPVNAADPSDALLRLPEVLQRMPISPSGWWKGVKDGRYPAAIKLGPRTTCWRASEVDALIKSLRGNA
jgi:predicted DNA-binding transcriptional regulator AlpA